MRQLSILCLLSCMQSAPTASPHRLRVGHYVSSDGASAHATDLFFDTVLNTQCSPALSRVDDETTRCFPDIGYAPRRFSDATCTSEIIATKFSGLTGHMVGIDDGWHHVVLAGAENPFMASFWQREPSGECVNVLAESWMHFYATGDDVTASLETLNLEWRDSP